MMEFILMVNKQGQTRLAQYYGQQMAIEERSALESEIVRKCLARSERVCSFLDYEGYRIIYRRYASLFFIVGISNSEETASSINELSILEFIHTLVETLDKYFESVCELDIMFNLEKTHYILAEMVINGRIIDTNRDNVLGPIRLLDTSIKRGNR